MPIDWPFLHKLSANWLPIDCPLNANWELIKEFISVSANRSLPSIEGSVRLAGSEMNQSNANWLTIRFQTDCQLTTNHCPFKANWELIKEFISVSANRSLPSIEGSSRLAGSRDGQIQWQLRSKPLDWPRFRIIRVPPLGISGGTSRPMRSQHSELSTNQKPWFEPVFWRWPKFESTNPMQMCQSDASLYRGKRPISRIWDEPIKCHLIDDLFTNWLPIDYQLIVLFMPIEGLLKNSSQCRLISRFPL